MNDDISVENRTNSVLQVQMALKQESADSNADFSSSSSYFSGELEEFML